MLRHSDPWTTIRPGFKPWSWVPFCPRDTEKELALPRSSDSALDFHPEGPSPCRLHWAYTRPPGSHCCSIHSSRWPRGDPTSPNPWVARSPPTLPPPERTVSAHRAQCLACIVSRLIT